MLWFIGLGISGPSEISPNTRKIIKNADIVYLETFTSPIPRKYHSEIRAVAGKRLKAAPRWLVEDGKTILAEAKKKKVVMLTYGDPYIATTHIELRTRAELDNIRTRTVHAASAIPSLIGECGLQYYKIGRPVTVMRERQSWNTVYFTIYDNLVRGMHSVLILEYNEDAGFFLDPKEAISGLLSAEEEQRRNVIGGSTFAIVASRIGAKNQGIVGGRLSSLAKMDFGRPPHTIIIPGRMHFTETDALKAFATCVDEPASNSHVKKISDQMLEKYIPKARKALEWVANAFRNDGTMQPIIQNAQLYLDDAEKFQGEGKEELAILSIGYAEGLLDALRLSKGIDPWT
ncbi:MAG: diphthine synthase [Thaumarchaeota archaeon]|nr:diphthine synthase [Nitrososphaerota archaeon]